MAKQLIRVIIGYKLPLGEDVVCHIREQAGLSVRREDVSRQLYSDNFMNIHIQESPAFYLNRESVPALYVRGIITGRDHARFHVPLSMWDRFKESVLKFNQKYNNNTLETEDVFIDET